MRCLSLDGTWNLGVCTQEFLRRYGKEITGLRGMKESGMWVIAGEVPGNYEMDMEKAGLIEDPFFGKNLLQSLDREMDHLFYERKFVWEAQKNKTYILRMEGVDTVADVYLNGKPVAHLDNMLMEHCIRLESGQLCEKENELLVHIIPVTLAARRYDNPLFQNGLKYEMDALNVRKSPYMFGWDIFPRMLSGGIWRSVFIEEQPEYRFLQSYLFTRNIAGDYSSSELEYFYELELGDDAYQGFTVELQGVCGESSFEKSWDVWGKAGHFTVTVPNPVLWWPRRSGEPALYQVEARLCRNGRVYASHRFRFGLRTVLLEKTSLTDDKGNGEFCFLVNGKKTFILGTNWVPLDSLPSRGKERIAPALRLVEDLDCNMIRCWGGGYYEDEEFYDRCDELGILVWQDFVQACGLYPERQDFLDNFEKEVTQQVRRLRQHACLALWSGDNENDEAYGWNTNFRLDPNENKNTRKIVPQVLRMNDYIRDYLPSSPYMDETAFRSGTGDHYLPEQHLWGPRDYYKGTFYRDAAAHFASETGYHGCPDAASIRKFISERSLWPYQHNEEWLLHASSPTTKEKDEPYAYRIELMANQIKVLFGEIPDNLESFALQSQISQAEAKKYFIERFRIGKWRRTGIIWWNVIDGCPQFSDAVVDYYYTKKLAYGYIKRAQQRVALMCDEPEKDAVRLVGVNDEQEARQVHYTVRELMSDTVTAQGETILLPEQATTVARLDTGNRTAFYLIEWQYDGIQGRNHYVTWEAPFAVEKYLMCAEKAKLFQ